MTVQPHPARSTCIISRDHACIGFASGLILTGTLSYIPAMADLHLTTNDGIEDLSIQLHRQGIIAAPGCVLVKDWSEHVGLAQELVEAGYAQIVRQFTTGPFDSRAYEMQVTL